MIKQNILKIISLAILGCLIGAAGILLKDYFTSPNLFNSKAANSNLALNFERIIQGKNILITPTASMPETPKPTPAKFNRLKIQRKLLAVIASPSPFPSPSPSPSPFPSPSLTPLASSDDWEWGVAKQISEHTWTIKVQPDDRMTTAQELFEALNNYRRTRGAGTLAWDQRLADYAQTRVDCFTTIGKTDEHAGINKFLDNDENFKKLGFAAIGENSSYGYQMLGVHLIEWIYAADSYHDNNQLDSDWSHVGIGINGTASDLIFGGEAL